MKTILTLTFVCVFCAIGASAQNPGLTRGPYLQMAIPEQDEPGKPYVSAGITVRWRTAIASKGAVMYSTDPDFRTNKVVREPAAVTDHSVQITGLESDTRYYYSVEAYDPFWKVESTEYHFFTTPPKKGVQKKTKIWVLGDFGTDPPTKFNTRQDSTIDAIQEYMRLNNTGPMDLWLWLGDNAYDIGSDNDFQQNIFDKTRARYDWAFRQTPFYATPGNHDYRDGGPSSRLTHQIHYFSVVDNFKNGEAGGVPSGKEEYYSFDYSNIHFISLDSYGFEKAGDTDASILAPESVQHKWLIADLQQARANPAINWIIVFTHMPPYTGGTHNSDSEPELAAIRRNLVPLLDTYKVDLLFTGHSHNYERSRLMRGHYEGSTTFRKVIHNPADGSNAKSSGKYDGTPNSCFYYKTSGSATNEGIIHVVNGGGGRGEYFQRNRPLIDSVMYMASTTGGSVYVEVENKKLIARYIGANKKVLDEFVIYKDLDNFTVPVTDGTARIATCECTEDLGPNRSFTHYLDNKANLLLSINRHGTNIGKVGVAPFEVKLVGAPGRTNVGAFYPGNYVRASQMRTFSSGWRVMNRYWTVKPAVELTGNNQVTVRHYFKFADEVSLSSTNLDDQVHGQMLKFYKINQTGTTTYDPDPRSGSHSALPGALTYNQNGLWIYEGSFVPSLNQWKAGFLGKGGFYPRTDSFYGEIVVGKLAGSGGIGGQGGWINPAGAITVLRAGDRWSYMAKGVPPEKGVYTWKDASFAVDRYYDLSAWEEGGAPLGYSPGGEDGEKRVLPACQSERNCYEADEDGARFIPGCQFTPCTTRWTTTYFRRALFNYWGYDSFFKSVMISYRRDDGVIIYINGKELLPRDANMPAGAITDATFASNAAAQEHQWYTIVVPNDNQYLRPGLNIIAVELHQNSATSSDAYFDMEIVLSPDVLTSPVRTGITEALLSGPATTLYPNPSEGPIVYLDKPLVYNKLYVSDQKGVLYRKEEQPGIVSELDISALPLGMLILVAWDEEKVVRYKIIKK
ncbi:metallophosphoesterase [Dyadobacter fermentans]|uniref:Metallophosphoesterase n=1 Tax=Dyadobacter fermentans (strain ATCC 700827 / DSM 18053 / CIP 107007 / KCTC 52180 / NS114) TaxID=471854 RepID=C6VYM2_DYAFD|nr:metallophosphoesterase [Dyadobacter fermentans]ACT93377.1 metallophosphoesterase [Dyadobacter fermentans DSM 18053]